MRQGSLSIHSENILPIIKKWLYSEKDIFVRELAANASDAIQKLHVLHARGEASSCKDPRIDISLDKEKKTITFSDTGLGLDAEEAEKFLAQIAFSGAEDFIKTYKLNDTFIGHFGLGFFSVFMVADTVDVISKSYKEGSEAILFHSNGSSSYTIDAAAKEEVGTDIILHINQENEEYLDEKRLLSTLKRFCSFFPYPLFFNKTNINKEEPLWQKKPSECSEDEYKAFYKVLYPFEEDPLFWIHLNVDYPFHVKGILYFPRFTSNIELQKDHVKLYCNRVFVSDDCKDILPDYLVLLRGVLDSPDIPLNVSRSHLQVDATVRQLAGHISRKVSDALSSLLKSDRSRFENCWDAYELVIKLGMLQDEKFYQRSKDLLLFKTSGNTYKKVEELSFERDGKKQIMYCDSGQELSPLMAIYKEKGIPVAITSSPLDPPLMSKLEKEERVLFRRIDAALDAALLDHAREKTILDDTGRTEAAHIADFFKASIGSSSIDVDAKSLSSDSLPAILTLEEEERRLRDYLARVSKERPQLKPKATLVVNTNNPLIQSLQKMRTSSPDLAKDLALHIFDLTRLNHKELNAEELQSFIARSSKVLEALATR